MMKKMFILTATMFLMLFSANLFCDIKIINQTGDTVIASVEGVTHMIPSGGAKSYLVTVRDGKTLDELQVKPRDAGVKWIRLHGPAPIVYRTIVPVPKDMYLLEGSPAVDGGGLYTVWTYTWLGVEGGALEETKNLKAKNITYLYDAQISKVKQLLRDFASLNFNEIDAVLLRKTTDLKKSLKDVYFDMLKK